MVAGVPDRNFGNTGTIWTGVPVQFPTTNPDGTAITENHYVGGSVIDLHVLENGTPCLVISSRGFDASPNPPPRAVVAAFPRDGAPRERGHPDGVRLIASGTEARRARPIASCVGPPGNIRLLVAERTTGSASDRFAIRSVSVTGRAAGPSLAIPTSALFDPAHGPWLGNAKLAAFDTRVVLASSDRDLLRISVLAEGGRPIGGTIPLAGAGGGQLSGVVYSTLASVRTDASGISVAATVYRNDPVFGSVSQGLLLRVRSDNGPDRPFERTSVWVTPLLADLRSFVCAGETSIGLAGVSGGQAVAFAVLPDASDLDLSFGVGGIARQDLAAVGGTPSNSVRNPISAEIPNRSVWVLAERTADSRCVGCRFRLAPGSGQHGDVEPFDGGAATTLLSFDGGAVTPVAAMAGGRRLYLAVTRTLRMVNGDSVPTLMALEASSGRPAATFGAGGVTLAGFVGAPAAVTRDGATWFTEPAPIAAGVSFQRISADGGSSTRIVAPPVAQGFAPVRLKGLADGSVLVAGEAAPGTCVAKLSPTGALDAAFGGSGIVTLTSAASGPVQNVVEHSDGSIYVLLGTSPAEVVRLRPDGTVDPGYGTGGVASIPSFTHYFPEGGSQEVRGFLDEDGSLFGVVTSTHVPADSNSAPVHVALRRLDPLGQPDPLFGLGAPSVAVPSNAVLAKLFAPAGAPTPEDDYRGIDPVGVTRLGGRIYLVATGWSGGRRINQPFIHYTLPEWPVLLVMRWNANGSVDRSFGRNGWQEAGYHVDPGRRLYFGVRGVVSESPASVLAYGTAGTFDPQHAKVRQPQPALFRIAHPGGVDLAWAPDGARVSPVQEVLAGVIAGAMLPSGVVRVAYADLLRQPVSAEPRSTLGGVVQFR